jgi:hypothetical protein
MTESKNSSFTGEPVGDVGEAVRVSRESGEEPRRQSDTEVHGVKKEGHEGAKARRNTKEKEVERLIRLR